MRQLGTMIAVILFAVAGAGASETLGDTGRFRDAREQMVRRQIESRGISDWQVLDAMRKVLRHQFVSERLQPQAYEDHPLPIGEGQTISQPYIVALMTETLDLKSHHRVLEIGTGSGYQAAILAEIVSEVYTMEIKPALHQVATAALKRMNYSRVFTRCADGYFGWPESAPFDAVMITAAIDHIPPPLLEQLKVGGRLILPLGNPFSYQNLTVVTKTEKEYTVKQVLGVLFVPMTGHALGGKR